MKTKKMMLHSPELLHALLNHLTEALVTYVCHQIQSGAQALPFHRMLSKIHSSAMHVISDLACKVNQPPPMSAVHLIFCMIDMLPLDAGDSVV